MRQFVEGHAPRPPKGSKKWNPLIIPYFPQCSNGFILGGFQFLDPLGGLGGECRVVIRMYSQIHMDILGLGVWGVSALVGLGLGLGGFRT